MASRLVDCFQSIIVLLVLTKLQTGKNSIVLTYLHIYYAHNGAVNTFSSFFDSVSNWRFP